LIHAKWAANRQSLRPGHIDLIEALLIDSFCAFFFLFPKTATPASQQKVRFYIDLPLQSERREWCGERRARCPLAVVPRHMERH